MFTCAGWSVIVLILVVLLLLLLEVQLLCFASFFLNRKMLFLWITCDLEQNETETGRERDSEFVCRIFIFIFVFLEKQPNNSHFRAILLLWSHVAIAIVVMFLIPSLHNSAKMEYRLYQTNATINCNILVINLLFLFRFVVYHLYNFIGWNLTLL